MTVMGVTSSSLDAMTLKFTGMSSDTDRESAGSNMLWTVCGSTPTGSVVGRVGKFTSRARHMGEEVGG